MIYLITKQPTLYKSDLYTIINTEESISIINNWELIQFDTETDGRDCHINKLLTMQFGYAKKNIQIIVDCSTINPILYKNVLESKLLIGQNLKFDLQFLYNYGIVPRMVYDTMIVEQVLYLGASNKPKDPNFISVSLQSIAKRRLNIDIDKSIRGEIRYRGLDESVIKYAAGDVMYLEDIMKSQKHDYIKNNCKKACKLECDFVPVIAYMEWCGIKLDIDKWHKKWKKIK